MSDGPPDPTISIIAAVAKNGVIGAADGLPWRVRADLRHFKASTIGKPLIVGRKTFASTNGPLPNRLNIVITRDSDFSAPGARIAGSLDEAFEIARDHCAKTGADEIMIGGGGEIYRQAMDRADCLIITHVDIRADGDTVFPPIDPSIWVPVDKRALDPNDGDTARAQVIEYRRRNR